MSHVRVLSGRVWDVGGKMRFVLFGGIWIVVALVESLFW